MAIDAIRLNRLQFSALTLVVSNESGRYNPEDNEASLWFGYLQQQRTLVKIEVGFLQQVRNDDGTWVNIEFPGESVWDEAYWDLGSEWDDPAPIAFKGVINGDIVLTDSNEITLNVSPLLQVFRDFSARNLTGLDSSMTASRFMTLLRDQTDGSGNFVFRPFFDDTTSAWDIATTTVTYSNLNTNTAKDIRAMNVWEVVEKLAESENHVAFISRDGTFRFRPRDANTAAAAFEFFGGPGVYDSTYGHTIKKIQSYGKKQSKFYSRVEVQYREEDTTTSFEIVEATLTVASNNAAWNLGQKTIDIQNFWIPTSTVAESIAESLFQDYSAVKNEVEFTTSLVPHLDILDRVAVTYDASPVSANSLWDQFDWAETMGAAETGQELIFDANTGEALKLSGDEFKFQSIEIDLDKLECKFSAREV